ncbi:DUF2017 domain-containing protein [Nocardioides limicola]|uniref:DUF2017 domain-containing protein n=1 Tax=Nocardioides limicola TaxID=2803368 RepID=UPI00193B98AB|nr:DUF2017 domain-containing protein [Nocardioides sp. DJM-14]
MSGFARHLASGAVIAHFNGLEADLLRSLASQLVELLHNEQAVEDVSPDPLRAMLDFTGPVSEPDDPVLARLFPNAYRDDEEAAADFRRYTEGGLRDGKARAASTVIDCLEEAGLPEQLTEEGLVIDVELDPATAEVWLRSFTDIRLALAVRLGVEEDDEAYWHSLPDDDPRVQAHDIYDWMGYLQETLVTALA